jgi:hypothetical protein
MRRSLLTLAIVVGILVTSGWAQQSRVTWEYKTEGKCSDEKRINALGAEGWELAGFTSTESGLGGNWRCIFKRPK